MSIVLFYLSLFFIVAILTTKYFGISFNRHKFISDVICENDEKCHKLVNKSRRVISKIKFKNFHKLTVLLISFLKKEIIYFKRKFDSKQPAFFLSVQKPNGLNKSSSFFFKKVSEYKNSINNKKIS
jgi:hypothetical protein